MTQQRGTRDVVWIGLLAGLFALLCINVAVGIREGFARPPGGVLLVLLSAPGLALGWGGVALLFVAIPYALLTWRHGKGPGSVLAVLGSLVFAFGVGGLTGVLTSPAAAGGGRMAGGLASLLRDGVGTGFAGAILALVAVPGLLLALAPLILDPSGLRTASRAEGGKGAKAWYPERRVASDGTELPPEFGNATDVGPIRYREPGERPPIPTATASTVTLSPPSAGGPAAKKSKPIAGIRYADEPLPDVGSPPPAAREVADDELPSGVRYARSETPAVADAPAVGADEGAALADGALTGGTEAAGDDVDDVGPPREVADPAPVREARALPAPPPTGAATTPSLEPRSPAAVAAPTPVRPSTAAPAPVEAPAALRPGTAAPTAAEAPKRADAPTVAGAAPVVAPPQASESPKAPEAPKVAESLGVPGSPKAAAPLKAPEARAPVAAPKAVGLATPSTPTVVTPAGTPTPATPTPVVPAPAAKPEPAPTAAAAPSAPRADAPAQGAVGGLPRADAFEPAAPLPAPAPLAELRKEPPAPPTPKLAHAAPVPATTADAAVNEAVRSSAAYRRKLDATGIVDGGGTASATARPPTETAPRPPTDAAPRPAMPPKPRPPKPARPKDLHDAIRGLFSSLPMEELPPVQPVIDPPEPTTTEPRVDPPGQRTLFDDAATPRAPGQRHPGTADALFGPSVEAALERGSASLVLLKRKLGVGYARAASLMEALVEEGILGEMTASGSRPTLITAAEWQHRAGR